MREGRQKEDGGKTVRRWKDEGGKMVGWEDGGKMEGRWREDGGKMVGRWRGDGGKMVGKDGTSESKRQMGGGKNRRIECVRRESRDGEKEKNK